MLLDLNLSFAPGQNHLRDIIDALISISNDKRNDGRVPPFSNDKIISTVNDIFGADGKIRLGSSRFDDRKDLHYTEAFISEILRHTSFIPFIIPHRKGKIHEGN
ncbi:cytochrome P450 1A1-like [Dermochelys coriacea]|uniref:cytochrome P450 1A1-like n=1 Tax=Dermochelys coriacea TaxID=27794 RepID=UPI001CA9108A|nr:cytochrome P450 1A1-like [Dermochelys coriacea]